MTEPYSQNNPGLITGVARVIGGDFAALFLSMLIAILFSRGLGPESFGIYVLATALLYWVENLSGTFLFRATVRFVADASHGWRSMGSMILRWQLIISLSVTALFVLAAPLLAQMLGLTNMTGLFQLIAVHIPLSGLCQAYRGILVGSGRYGKRALGPMVNQSFRLVMAVILFSLGLSVKGAILALIAGALAELCMYFFYQFLPLWLKAPMPISKIMAFASPLYLNSMALFTFRKLALIMLGVLMVSSHHAGYYGVAVRLCAPVMIFANSYSALLLSDLTRTLREGDTKGARKRIKDTWELLFFLLPVAGVVVGSASEVIEFLFGKAYMNSAAPFYWLLFSSFANVFIYASSSMLIAMKMPGRVLRITFWMPFAAFGGHALMIPLLAEKGAAIITVSICMIAAILACRLACRVWHVFPSGILMLKSVLLFALLLVLSQAWPLTGPWVIAKLVLLSCLGVAAWLLSGDFNFAQLKKVLSSISDMKTCQHKK